MRLIELPPENWHRLKGWQIYGLLPFADPQFARIFAVEDASGEIVGVQGALSFVHLHGLQIAPAHQGKAAVARLLRHAVMECLGEVKGAMTGAETPEVEAIIRKMGGIELDMKPFYLPLSGVESTIAEEV